MNRFGYPRFVILAAAFAITSGLRAERADPVAVAAGADKDYVKSKMGGGGAVPKAESYVFARGSFFGGYLPDSSLADTQFMEIARTLAPGLSTQHFYPAPDKKKADLLIVVHWGITSVEEQTNEGTEVAQMNNDLRGLKSGAIRDPHVINMDLSVQDAKTGIAGSGLSDNAQLLGYNSAFQEEEYRSLGVSSGYTEMDQRLRDDLLDERYFVILMAYDFNTLKEGKKGTKPKLLWSTHFSMRATGHNFTTALPAMSEVAAHYFGKNLDGLLLDARKTPEGKVEVGEPKEVVDKPKQN
jgi:hypothetical protein